MTSILDNAEDFEFDSAPEERPEAPEASAQDFGPMAHVAPDAAGNGKATTSLVSIADAVELLQAAWKHPIKATSTGLKPLDKLLQGGLRPGDFVAVVGAAGGGKSALVGQIAIDAAKSGAVVMYASIEMPATEILARWLAREVFDLLKDDEKPTGDLGYSAILFGEDIDEKRLNAAYSRLSDAAERVFVQQVVPGSTVDDLTKLVKAAREMTRQAAPNAPFVLVVDPLQRFYASESGKRVGSALNAVNANETERIGAVAQELKAMCDHEQIAVIVTSDTTKAAAGGYQSSSQSLRGSYQFNHLATLVLGLHSKETPEDLDAYLEKGRNSSKTEGVGEVSTMTESDFDRAMPKKWHSTPAKGLGARTILVECSKNRRGAPQDFALGAVLGAAWFGCTGDDDFGRSPPKAKAPNVAKTKKSKQVPQIPDDEEY